MRLLFVLFILLCFSKLSFAEDFGTIYIKVTGYDLTEGKLVVSLLNNKDSYITSDKAPYKYLYLRNFKKKDGYYECEFSNVPYGEYAIQMYYDKNDNDKLDITFGYPKEKYGFSNNATAFFSKPDYKKTCFQLNSKSTTQKIYLK